MEPIENPYVEVRNGGYYVAGSRIGLDVLYFMFKDGASPEYIMQEFPSLGPLRKVYGVILFMLEHPDEMEAYLREQESLMAEIQRRYPMPDRFRTAASPAE